MADDKPWSVAFAGTGDTSEANVAALLDDWLPEKLEHLTVPSKIGRAHKGLKNVQKWLVSEVGEDVIETGEIEDRGDEHAMASILKGHNDHGADAYLVFIPAEEWEEDSPEARLVRACIAEQIPVKDLSAGLDDFVPPDPETGPEPAEEQEKPKRTRGKPRNTAPAAPAEPDRSNEPVSETLTRLGITKPQEPAQSHDTGGVTVNLSPATIQALLALAGALAQDIKASVVDGLPDSVKPKVKLYPFWMDEDGNYRSRSVRGRGKNGETKVDLTAAEVKELGLEVPE